MEKRITWKKEKLKRGITAFNSDGEELGWLQLEKIGRHMHWCWYQNEDIRMSPGCLQEVRDMQKEAFKKRTFSNLKISPHKKKHEIKKGDKQ